VHVHLLRFAVLVIPAGAALLWWRRAGILSKHLYFSCWSNASAYCVWLTLVVLLSRIRGIPSAPRLFDALVGFLIATPLIALFFSLVLLLSSLFAEPNEKWTMGSSSALMVVLWASSLIMPN
jgi:hypothetical protein